MSKLKHSQGPWIRCMANNGNCPCGLIWDKSGYYVIASVQSSCKGHESTNLGEGLLRGSETYIANSKLIEAAPEMLEALIWFCKRMQNLEVRSTKTYNRYVEIIEKVTGSTIEEVLNGDI